MIISQLELGPPVQGRVVFNYLDDFIGVPPAFNAQTNFQALLEQWIHKRTAAKAALQSLVGKLIFISKCVRQSRIFIARILILLRNRGISQWYRVVAPFSQSL